MFLIRLAAKLGLARWPSKALRRLHRDEQGDEGVNKILIIAMVAIPLIIVLIFFGGEIVKFFQEAWANLTGTADEIPDDENPFGT